MINGTAAGHAVQMQPHCACRDCQSCSQLNSIFECILFVYKKQQLCSHFKSCWKCHSNNWLPVAAVMGLHSGARLEADCSRTTDTHSAASSWFGPRSTEEGMVSWANSSMSCDFHSMALLINSDVFLPIQNEAISSNLSEFSLKLKVSVLCH